MKRTADDEVGLVYGGHQTLLTVDCWQLAAAVPLASLLDRRSLPFTSPSPQPCHDPYTHFRERPEDTRDALASRGAGILPALANEVGKSGTRATILSRLIGWRARRPPSLTRRLRGTSEDSPSQTEMCIWIRLPPRRIPFQRHCPCQGGLEAGKSRSLNHPWMKSAQPGDCYTCNNLCVFDPIQHTVNH
jgi:hypothetical protein